MLNIGNFLEKFVKLGKSKAFTKETLILSIKEIAEVEVKEEEIELKDEKVYLKCSPAFRNQIFMHREAIESALKSKKIFLKIC